MTDQTNVVNLPINETGLQRLSIEELNSLPDRLNDTMIERLKATVRHPLPDLEPCDDRHLSHCLRMMLSVLPRRHADDLSGEMFVEAYSRMLSPHSNAAISFMMEESLRVCRWFPTIAECLELIGGWRRNDEAVLARSKANLLINTERNRRDDEKPKDAVALPKVTQAAIDTMSDSLIKIGLGLGSLVKNADGTVSPAPEDAE